MLTLHKPASDDGNGNRLAPGEFAMNRVAPDQPRPESPQEGHRPLGKGGLLNSPDQRHRLKRREGEAGEEDLTQSPGRPVTPFPLPSQDPLVRARRGAAPGPDDEDVLGVSRG